MDFTAEFWKDKIALIDSRKLLFPEQTIFFALQGNKVDGHAFVEDLYAKGVRYFVLSIPLTKKYKSAQIVYTPNVQQTLQSWAAFHRQQFDIPTITGSNGKTTIKEWLFQLLQGQFNIIKSPKSYNSQLGVPLSVLGMKSNHDLAIFEAGISQVNEMTKLESILQPTIGIFSNIGKAHAAGFGRQTQKIHEKLVLFKNCKCLIYRYEHEKIRDEIVARGLESRAIAWGGDKAADIPIKIVKLDNGTTEINFTHSIFSEFSLVVPFSNQAAIENCIHAIIAGLYLGATCSI
jgi:alanine racemase